MKSILRRVFLFSLTTLLASGSLALAQQGPGGNQDRPGRGNFDPEQMRARMMERYRETLEVTDDAEWKAIESRITKVTEARRSVGTTGAGMGMMMRGRGGRGGDNAQADDQRPQRRGPFGAEANPDLDALQKAIDSKASADEIKSKLAKYRESRKTKEAELEKAQEDLRKLLTVRQEAIAVSMGLLR